MHHLNEQLFHASREQQRKAQRNVELAREFMRMHPRAIVATAGENGEFSKQLREQTKKKAAERPGQQQQPKPKEKPDKGAGRQYVLHTSR